MAETNHIMTKGTASGSSEARVRRTEFSQSFQETGFVCKTHDDHNNDDRKASRRLTESSHASGPPQSQAAPWQGHLGPSRLWSAFKVLVPGEGGGWRGPLPGLGRRGGLGYRASRVGEFKESEDWSPLLLLLRWALEQDSEGEAGDSCSRTLG